MALFSINKSRSMAFFLRSAKFCRNYLTKGTNIATEEDFIKNQNLPSPPVPDLNTSLERYLAGLRPVISTSQYEKTCRLVEQFRKDPGPKLQDELLRFSDYVDNWVTYFWLDDMYLKNPLPLPVHSNGIFLLPKQNFHSFYDQLRFAAKLILYTLDYKSIIDRKGLQPDVMKTRNGMEIPLCMKTYYSFFPAYRRPGELKDELIMSVNQKSDDPWHIIVACNGQFFKLQVKAANTGEFPSEDILIEQLSHITRMSKDKENIQQPVALLTTENRPTWARIRNKMIKNKVNLQNLQAIEDSIFILSLDMCSSTTPNCPSINKEHVISNSVTTDSMHHVLHGGGTDAATPNRWFDKFMQFVVTRDGVAGFLGEHSTSEGITVVGFLERFIKHLRLSLENQPTDPALFPVPQPSFQMPTPLIWDIDEEISQEIKEASKKINRLIRDVDLLFIRFTKYGKNFIKSLKISPDAYLQTALQLAQYKIYGKLVSTYESASLRRFENGRIDTIRSDTQEALEWVKAMCDEPQTSDEIKVELFQSSLQKQAQIMTYTANGESPDNHLLALREIAKSKKYPEIPLFTDKSYKEYLNFRLSTSQFSLSSEENAIMAAYGAVVPDGYGCCYLICSDHIDIIVSSFHSSKETSSAIFANSLADVLLEIGELCEKTLLADQLEQKSHN